VPLLLAIATTVMFSGLLGRWWVLAGAGAAGCLAALLAWLTPTPPIADEKARIYA